MPFIQAPAVPITQAMPNYTGNQPMHGNGNVGGGGGGYRTQKMPTQHNNYHQQQQQQHQPQTMPYKNQQPTNKMR